MGYIARAATAKQPNSQQNTIGKQVAASFMSTFVILTTVWWSAVMFLGEIMILVSTLMTILALYYSLIKRTILLCGVRRKLKKGAAQNLRHNQTVSVGQNTVLATQFSPLSFQESLELSRKDYFMIFSIAFIVIVLFAVVLAFFSHFPKSAIFLYNYTPLLLKVGGFGMLLLFWFCACIIVALPITLIFHSILYYGVKKTMKRLETCA
ncbi:hypothetical protein [Bartonella sp. AS69XJJH]|uniref:hypothetical protein n=1 Tax=Bartonella sp. AS69XJJH TaxID=3243508 RepID=UPI0035D00053